MTSGASSPVVLSEAHSGLRWRIALFVSAAIAISYLDRQTLPWAITAIQADIPISYQTKAFLDSAFLIAYGLMYIGGGWLSAWIPAGPWIFSRAARLGVHSCKLLPRA